METTTVMHNDDVQRHMGPDEPETPLLTRLDAVVVDPRHLVEERADWCRTPVQQGPRNDMLCFNSQLHTPTRILEAGQFRASANDSGAFQISPLTLSSRGAPAARWWARQARRWAGRWLWKLSWSAYPAQIQTPHLMRRHRTRTKERLSSSDLATKNQSHHFYVGKRGCTTNRRKGHRQHMSEEVPGSMEDSLLAHQLNSSNARSCYS